MITFRVTKVKEEKAFLALLDELAKSHRVKARYAQPCLPQTYQVSVDGQEEERFESDLLAFASKAGWLVNH